MSFGPQDVGRGYLAVLTIFTILEFFIAVIVTHFGCQATRAQANAVSTSTPAWAFEEGCGCGGSRLPAPPRFLLGRNLEGLRCNEQLTLTNLRGPESLCWKMGLFSLWPQGGASTNGPAAL